MSYFTKVIITDPEGHNARIDQTGYMTTMDIAHHEIHDGEFYGFSDELNLASAGNSGSWLLDTPKTGTLSLTQHDHGDRFER